MTEPECPVLACAEGADPLLRLRQATHALHEQLDSQLPLAKDGADRQDYLAHLRVIQPWLAALAPMLAPIGWGQDLAHRAAADLTQAGEAVPGTPSPHWPAHGPSSGFVWGVAYVVEGSQLGGRVLHDRLLPALDPRAMTYLHGRGDATGAHWRGFLQDMRQALRTPSDTDSACEGAVWAFTTLINNYKQQGLMA